ncbi:NAD(P)-binding domain-containing protein [Pseudoclavibacter helvolus]|uniref:NAD(P)-dependent oxidoreductase n=1 Tax=Pseudoclavibacter helvolus TaxID=255205 RepID=UPI003C75B183
MTRATLMGLGEAGAIYARGLRDAGFEVRAYDPFTQLDEAGINQLATVAEAVEGADLIVSLVGARAAQSVADAVFPVAGKSAVFADLNTGSPELKRRLGDAASASGIRFADVAVLAPVPRSGVLTPLMVSGDGAETFAEAMRPTGAEIESIGGDAGDAAARKLVRSSFMKGLAAVVLESVGAAQAAGCESWLRGQIASELGGDPQQLIDRLITGSKLHASRRVHEVEDTREYLASIHQPAWVAEAAGAWLTSLLEEAQQDAANNAHAGFEKEAVAHG